MTRGLKLRARLWAVPAGGGPDGSRTAGVQNTQFCRHHALRHREPTYAPNERLLTRRTSAPPLPSATAAGVPPLPDGAAALTAKTPRFGLQITPVMGGHEFIGNLVSMRTDGRFPPLGMRCSQERCRDRDRRWPVEGVPGRPAPARCRTRDGGGCGELARGLDSRGGRVIPQSAPGDSPLPSAGHHS